MPPTRRRKTSRFCPPCPGWVRQPQGSALILTLLILLVLTGLGMTAMHSVGRSLSQSGAYRVRTQATGLTHAALVYSSTDAGRHAKDYWRRMNEEQLTHLGALAADAHMGVARRGPHLELNQDPSATTRAFPKLTTAGETGLLTVGSNHSFEAGFNGSGAASQFSVMIRDPIDGPAAVGYGQEGVCFKKVTIAAQGMVGNPTKNWAGAGMVGSKRAAVETYIGPIPCGAH